MKPHIKRSHGAWVIYHRGKPCYRYNEFRAVCILLRGLGYGFWDKK